MGGEFRTSLLAQLPNWILAAMMAAAFYRWEAIPSWLAPAFVALWVVKDLLLFPMMREFYRSEPSERRMVGQRGIAITSIAPNGFVRVRGELWQAQSDDHINEGALIRVRDIDGLRLQVGLDSTPGE